MKALIRAARSVVAIGASTVPFAIAGAQGGTIIGRVVAKDSGLPAGYTIISATPGARPRFTGDNGAFTFTGISGSHVVVSARRIGYAPLDTQVTVSDRDTLRITLRLSSVSIQLPPVRSFAMACGHPGAQPDTAINLQLAMLFEQLKMNAERNALLSRSYPFEMKVERKLTRPEPALDARFIAFDTLARSSDREWRYSPGRLMGTREIDGGVFAGRWFTVHMPELADLADESFLGAHCFDFGGTDVIGGDTLIRIDFIPAPSVRTPDVSGAVFLERGSYQLRHLHLNLVNLSKQLQAQIDGQSIRAEFVEVLPGVPVLHFVSSMVIPKEDSAKPKTEPSTEEQRVLSVRFLRGRP